MTLNSGNQTAVDCRRTRYATKYSYARRRATQSHCSRHLGNMYVVARKCNQCDGTYQTTFWRRLRVSNASGTRWRHATLSIGAIENHLCAAYCKKKCIAGWRRRIPATSGRMAWAHGGALRIAPPFSHGEPNIVLLRDDILCLRLPLIGTTLSSIRTFSISGRRLLDGGGRS